MTIRQKAHLGPCSISITGQRDAEKVEAESKPCETGSRLTSTPLGCPWHSRCCVPSPQASTLVFSMGKSQGRTMQSRVSFSRRHWGLSLVTRAEMPMPQLLEQALHSVVCTKQFSCRLFSSGLCAGSSLKTEPRGRDARQGSGLGTECGSSVAAPNLV